MISMLDRSVARLSVQGWFMQLYKAFLGRSRLKIKKIKIDLPVEGTLVIRKGAEVEVFLNANPLRANPPQFIHASYHASILPTNVLASRVEVEFTDLPEDI